MSCKKCKGITKEQLYIGYYLCKFNSTDEVEYIVKPDSKECGNYKQKHTKQEKETCQKN